MLDSALSDGTFVDDVDYSRLDSSADDCLSVREDTTPLLSRDDEHYLGELLDQL